MKFNPYEMEDNASTHSQTPLDVARSAGHHSEPSALYHHSSSIAAPRSASSSQYTINLGYQPGESDVGYENVAFTRGSGSIEGSVYFTGKLHRPPRIRTASCVCVLLFLSTLQEFRVM